MRVGYVVKNGQDQELGWCCDLCMEKTVLLRTLLAHLNIAHGMPQTKVNIVTGNVFVPGPKPYFPGKRKGVNCGQNNP